MTQDPTTTSSEPQTDDPFVPPVVDPAALCPYCGLTTPRGSTCAQCGGALDPLSIQATQNQMGPWFIHDLHHPHRPGCSHQTVRKLAQRGRISLETVLRGPTTRQFWSLARNVRGVAHLLGECHNCHESANEDEYMCRNCGAVFEAPTDRQLFGVGAVRLIPGQEPAEVVAHTVGRGKAEASNLATLRPTSLRTNVEPHRRERGGGGESVAVKRLKHKVNQQRQMVTVSVATNVVLLAALLVAGLSPRFLMRPREAPAGLRAATAGDTAGNTIAERVDDSSIPNDGAEVGAEAISRSTRRDELAKIQLLASSGRREDLLAAEQLLVTFEKDAGSGGAFIDEAQQLQESIRRRLDAQSLEKFLPEEPS